jgi:hypothetical protein
MRDTDTIIDGVGALVFCVFLLATFGLAYTIGIPTAEVIVSP